MRTVAHQRRDPPQDTAYCGAHPAVPVLGLLEAHGRPFPLIPWWVGDNNAIQNVALASTFDTATGLAEPGFDLGENFGSGVLYLARAEKPW